jgi:cell division protein FtsW
MLNTGDGGALMQGGQRRHRPDYQIVLFIGLLMLIGLIVMYAIGPQRANVLNEAHNTTFYTDTYFVIKQLASLGLAVLAFIVMMSIPFELMKKHGLHILLAALGLSVLLFIFGNVLHIDAIATNTLGAYRWFNLGVLGSFQPAEVLKLALIIYMSGFLAVRYREGKINDHHATIYPMVALSVLTLFIIVVLQKDMGTGVAVAATILLMLIASGVSWKILAKIGLVAVIAAVLLTVFVPHRRERLLTFFQGDQAASQTAESDDSNYHIKNAMIALGSGGVTGRGIGQSVQSTGYLPEAINDSIFAIIGEIFGFVGTTLVVVLFGALLMRLLRIAEHQPDMSMRIAAAGIFGWLGAHVLMNVASMIGLIPLTGITLPLLSFGGTSMVVVTGALGLAFQLSRYTAHQPVSLKEAGDENSVRRRGLGGTRYSSRRSHQRIGG